MFNLYGFGLSAAGGAIAASVLALFLHNASIDRLNSKHKEAIEAQTRFNIQQCQDSKTPTEEGNVQYQKIIADRDAAIAKLQKRPARCVHVSKPSDSAKATKGKHGDGDGLPSDILLKYAGFCEAYRGSAETLYDFNGKVRCKLAGAQ